MLEFNQEHKAADLSAIKSKIKKSKKTGPVMLCGILLSAVLLLSGALTGTILFATHTNQETDVVQPITSSTAIIMENGNAMIVDLQSYEKYIDERVKSFTEQIAVDRTWILHTSDGYRLLVDADSVQFIEGEDSHEKAEIIAQELISKNGQVTCYDEVQSYGKTK